MLIDVQYINATFLDRNDDRLKREKRQAIYTTVDALNEFAVKNNQSQTLYEIRNARAYAYQTESSVTQLAYLEPRIMAIEFPTLLIFRSPDDISLDRAQAYRATERYLRLPYIVDIFFLDYSRSMPYSQYREKLPKYFYVKSVDADTRLVKTHQYPLAVIDYILQLRYGRDHVRISEIEEHFGIGKGTVDTWARKNEMKCVDTHRKGRTLTESEIERFHRLMDAAVEKTCYLGKEIRDF